MELAQKYARGIEDETDETDGVDTDETDGVETDGVETDGTDGSLGRSLLRGVRATRVFSTEHAVASVREWASCDPLSPRRDRSVGRSAPAPVSHGVSPARVRRQNVQRLQTRMGRSRRNRRTDEPDEPTSTREETTRGGSLPHTPCDLEDERGMRGRSPLGGLRGRSPLKRTFARLSRGGLVPRSIRALISDPTPCRMTMALVVCLDDVVPPEEREEDEGMFVGTRPSRLGVRLLERHALATDATMTLEREIERLSMSEGGSPPQTPSDLESERGSEGAQPPRQPLPSPSGPDAR